MALVRKTTQYPPFKLILLTTLIGIGLAAVTVQIKKHDIALDLSQEVNKALVFAGLPLVSVSFEGRDGTLSGTLASESLPEQVIEVAVKVNGVRQINNQLQVNTAVEGTTDISKNIDVTDADFENGLYVPPRDHPLEKYNLSKVQFAYAQLQLREESFPVLDRLAMILQQNPQIQLELSVHTANQGTALGQFAASQSRADIIKFYLVEQGVKPDQLVAKGYGASRPVASNETSEGQEQNRRVEIRVLKDG